MSLIKQPAFIFDLDGTLNHSAGVPGGLPIRGRTANSMLDPRVIEKLAMLSRYLDLFVATGRSEMTTADHRRHFKTAGISITGWILEHGAVVTGQPEWTENVLNGIDLNSIHAEIKSLVQKRNWPIDTDCYRFSHKGYILLSGNGTLLAEHLLTCLSGVLGANFRSIVGARKISIIPKLADKFSAFQACYGATHRPSFAVGDMPDDLSLLKNADYPLTLAGASSLVKAYVQKRGGFCSQKPGHDGISEVISEVSYRAVNKVNGYTTAGPRLPLEEIGSFRPSKCIYRDKLFAKTTFPRQAPDMKLANAFGEQLESGKKLIIEIRMRDWGGEAKALYNLLETMVPILPLARWRMIFPPERRGNENLKNFSAIQKKMLRFAFLPDKSCRLSAPGVPGSPADPGSADVVLLLYDHPDDLQPWYEHMVTRLITRHPEHDRTWFVNPMFLKITTHLPADDRKWQTLIKPFGTRVMMAANLVSKTDIHIATKGFKALAGRFDALIVAPRVVTNPIRNQLIKEGIKSIGHKFTPFSKLNANARPRVIFVDSYGDLPHLYAHCHLTYLGGGFDPRKRGFDPMESLIKKVPVIMGPYYDFNRIAVDSLINTKWVQVINKKETALADFVRQSEETMASPPIFTELEKVINQRQADSLRVALEVMGALCGCISRESYLFEENKKQAIDLLNGDKW